MRYFTDDSVLVMVAVDSDERVMSDGRVISGGGVAVAGNQYSCGGGVAVVGSTVFMQWWGSDNAGDVAVESGSVHNFGECFQAALNR